MKRMVTMQDLSCLGKCSLTVIHPVISAMGVSCGVLPTALLSTHTAFPGPAITDLSGCVAPILDHWAGLGAGFDGILTGYLANEDQVRLARSLFDRFGENALKVCDPAMGDHGRLYSGIGPEMVDAHRRLCCQADLCLPNLTEGALMAGLPVREDADEVHCRRIAEALLAQGAKSVLLTGYAPEKDLVGFFYSDGSSESSYAEPRLDKTCHGTGDLFAAVTMGGLMRGLSAPEAGKLACGFIRRCIAATQGDTRWGVAFEGELGWLIEQLNG